MARAASGVTRRRLEQKWNPSRSAPAAAAARAPPASQSPQIFINVALISALLVWPGRDRRRV
jgi:hypothetical protein